MSTTPTYILLIAYDVSDDDARKALLDTVRALGETREVSQSCYAVWTMANAEDVRKAAIPTPIPAGTYNVLVTKLTATPSMWSADARAQEIHGWIWERLSVAPPAKTYDYQR